MQITLGSRLNVACSYLINDFIDADSFAKLDDILGDFFDAVRDKDPKKAFEIAEKNWITIKEDGSVVIGDFEHYNVLFEMTLIPVA